MGEEGLKSQEFCASSSLFRHLSPCQSFIVLQFPKKWDRSRCFKILRTLGKPFLWTAAPKTSFNPNSLHLPSQHSECPGQKPKCSPVASEARCFEYLKGSQLLRGWSYLRHTHTPALFARTERRPFLWRLLIKDISSPPFRVPGWHGWCVSLLSHGTQVSWF